MSQPIERQQRNSNRSSIAEGTGWCWYHDAMNRPNPIRHNKSRSCGSYRLWQKLNERVPTNFKFQRQLTSSKQSLNIWGESSCRFFLFFLNFIYFIIIIIFSSQSIERSIGFLLTNIWQGSCARHRTDNDTIINTTKEKFKMVRALNVSKQSPPCNSQKNREKKKKKKKKKGGKKGGGGGRERRLLFLFFTKPSHTQSGSSTPPSPPLVITQFL